MADKEPRRRRKKKDTPRKEESLLFTDLIADESHSFSAHTKEPDKDLDEDSSSSHLEYEPSKLAQIIFIALFVVLSVIMGSVFFTLRGSSGKFPSDADVFDTAKFDAVDQAILHDIEEKVILQTSSEVSDDHESFIDIEEKPSITESFDESVDTKIEAEDVANGDSESFSPSSVADSSFQDSIVEEFSSSEPFTYGEDNGDVHSEEPVEVFTPSDESQFETDDDDDEGDVDVLEVPSAETADDVIITETAHVVEEAHPIDDESSMNTLEYEPESDFDDELVVSTLEEESRIQHNDESSVHILHDEPSIETFSEASPVQNSDIHPTKVVSDEASDDPAEDSQTKSHYEEVTSKVTPSPPTESLENLGRTAMPDKSEDISKPETAHLRHSEVSSKDSDEFIVEELNEIDELRKKNPESALQKYESLLKRNPSSPRALYGKARALDSLADLGRSNKLLEQAVSAYQEVLSAQDMPDDLYLAAGARCAERMQFRGFIGKSIKVLIDMEKRFPKNTDIKNKIGVGYLLIGQNTKAKEVFLEVLKENPNNGFAKVHLGFILKTVESKFEEAIDLLMSGIASREEGVIDGRFFFHLGDALARVGRSDEAMDVYKQGVKENLFLSAYQRSLYNVDGLTAKPWWDPENTRYSGFFKLLEKNWSAIKSEALSLLGSSNFIPESEGLKNYGEWEQLELFVRGRKVQKNCQLAPFTCSLVEGIPDASTCKRGQVKFSVMKPGTHVWAHTGPTNCRLRAHLGLVVPDKVFIRVANETRTWQDGKVILFDDSFEHEVWHNGTKPRLVLIVDFWHPDLTTAQKASLSPI